MKRDGTRRPPAEAPEAPPWLGRLRDAVRYGTYFDCLGLPRDASTTEVREAYRRVAADLEGLRPLCPGREDLAEVVAEATLAVEDAFTVLADPDLRLAYRRALDA